MVNRMRPSLTPLEVRIFAANFSPLCLLCVGFKSGPTSKCIQTYVSCLCTPYQIRIMCRQPVPKPGSGSRSHGVEHKVARQLRRDPEQCRHNGPLVSNQASAVATSSCLLPEKMGLGRGPRPRFLL